jgi:PAS domain-containing protein
VDANPAQDAIPAQPPRSTRQAPRPEVCAKVLDFEAALRERNLTQKQAAEALGVPRTTLLGWVASVASRGLTPAQRAFFESPEGVDFLRSLLVAALFVMNLCGGLGVAWVRTFFTLTGLHSLIACSETSLRKVRATIITGIGAWGDAQDAALAKGMAPKELVGTFDENFHQEMTLVAMNAASGFLLVEKVATRRDSATWAAALREGLAKWPVRLVGLVGDEARGLLRCAKVHLGVCKGSDLFHLQHEILRAVGGALARLGRAAQEARGKAQEALEAVKKARATYATSVHGPGRPPDWLGRQGAAEAALAKAAQEVVVAQAHREARNAAVRDLGERYHPVDLRTGALLSTDDVESRLLDGFDAIWVCAGRAGLGEQSARVIPAVAKAQRVRPSLAKWVAAWHRLVRERIAALGLSEPESAWVRGTLLPAVYLDRVVKRGSSQAFRARVGAVRDRLVAAIQTVGSPWSTWDTATRGRVLAVVQACEELFVRTSSPVEGRNGQLALQHHHTHHLTPALLKALTVIHNYVLTRRDGTTAAERFTGQKHEDLFAHLVAILPPPARPRVRKLKEKPPMLAVA